MPSRITSLAFLIVLTSCCCFGAIGQEEPQAEVPHSEAEFTIPTDPTRAILSVTLSPGLSRDVPSAILYGDGRLELTDGREKFIRHLTLQEIEEVISNAVTTGLAEWDGLAIRAKEMQKMGKPFGGRADGTRATIILGVDDYRRGSILIDRVERTISVRSAYFSREHFPEISEFKGVADLADWMRQQLKTAKIEAGVK